ncbi:shikimate dehydrogenase [Paenirhodobacter enshiensis]|uniref:shikimate dehydrogenase n=1 Tax=Paenirhodobacter enshiensis TaxID=1105367 RepID=UPI003FA31F70
MTDHPRIPLAAVIGSPVAHSRSPAVHGYWLRQYGIPGYYIPVDIAARDLSEAMRAMHKMGFVGCNVTIPHKEAALALADSASETAVSIGAANTMTLAADGSIFADNTDGYGFIANLRAGAPLWRPEAGPAAVIGAGGAARAIVHSLLAEGVPEVRIANRTRARAEALRDDFGPRLTVVDWAEAADMFDGAATVVNTSSLGMQGKAEFDIALDALSAAAVVTDCVYTPLETPLLRGAAARGCVTVDGLGMLLHQAVPGFERWFGHRPEVTEDLRLQVLSA